MDEPECFPLTILPHSPIHPFSQDPSRILSQASTHTGSLQGKPSSTPATLSSPHLQNVILPARNSSPTSKVSLPFQTIFPIFTLFFGGGRWRERKKEYYIRVGPAPKMNLGRTDILTPSQWGWPLPPLICSFHKYFLSSRHCSKSWDTCSLVDHILLGGRQMTSKYIWYYLVHKGFPLGLHTSHEHCTLHFMTGPLTG